MMYLVKQIIVTPTRRISVGSIVCAEDIDGPLGAKEWVRFGFLSDVSAPADALVDNDEASMPVEMPADPDTE